MKTRITLATCAFVVALFSPRAVAGIVSVSGDVSIGTIPSSLENNATTGNSNLFLFLESQNVALPSALSVDIQTPGSYSWFSSGALASSGGTVATGTSVDSYLLHFEPASGIRSVSGAITFSEPILGLMVRASSLSATDAVLGSPGTSYDNSSFRGTESIFDRLTLSSDSMSLTVDRLFSFGAMDEVRVVTASVVPEPPTVALALLGLVAIGWSRRDRANSRSPR